MPEALSVFTVPCLLTSPCFGFHQNVPLLLQGEGPEGEVCYPHPVMLSAAKHP
jgi:hypothetical protein